MSEQAGTESDVVEGVNEPPPSRLRQWIAPAWFLLGVLVGVIGFAAFATFNSAQPRLDSTAMREAARDGTLDAIATLQAGGPQPESRNPDSPVAQKAFAVREANRVGVKSARVTIVEFSDFQ